MYQYNGNATVAKTASTQKQFVNETVVFRGSGDWWSRLLPSVSQFGLDSKCVAIAYWFPSVAQLQICQGPFVGPQNLRAACQLHSQVMSVMIKVVS